MPSPADDLFIVAERLDETPVELLNGGAADGLRALDASVDEATAVARMRGIDPGAVTELWGLANARLQSSPAPDDLYPAAAEAASLLYAAAWVLSDPAATTEDLREAL